LERDIRKAKNRSPREFSRNARGTGREGDGRWASAHDSPAKASMPTEFLTELARNVQAQKFLSTLSKAKGFC